MAKTIDEVLAEPEDGELCSGVFDRILKYHGAKIDPSQLGEAERVVLLVSHVSGIIGNGGFRYLFEGDLPGDPFYALSAEAFATIGAHKAAKAFRDTLAIFPGSRPPEDAGKRLRYYLTHIKHWPTDQDNQFFEAEAERDACLATYIRSQADAYRHLGNPPAQAAEPEAEPEEPSDAGSEDADADTGGPLANLPHWKRVAFAASAARRVLQLLTRFWPDIPAKHPQAVLKAIELAEQSASQEEPAGGLNAAIVNAAVTVGAALATHPDWAGGESKPNNAHEGGIASFAAKSAQKAAEAAEASPDKSAQVAFDAWYAARCAAESADDDKIRAQLDLVLAQVCPSGDDDDDPDEEEAPPPRVHRGKALFLTFAIPLVLLNLYIIVAAVAGSNPISWLNSVVVPAISIAAIYWLWQGEYWLCWLMPALMVVSGSLRTMFFTWVLIKAFRLPPVGGRPLVGNVLASALWLSMALAAFELVAGLVFLVVPSVRAFFRYQRETAERTI